MSRKGESEPFGAIVLGEATGHEHEVGDPVSVAGRPGVVTGHSTIDGRHRILVRCAYSKAEYGSGTYVSAYCAENVQAAR